MTHVQLRSCMNISLRVNAACPSRRVNAWKLRIRDQTVVVTPAHIALWIKQGVYKSSPFTKSLNLDWWLPKAYLPESTRDFGNDLAWAFVDEKGTCLDTTIDPITHSTDAQVFFQQPYDGSGVWDSKASTLGKINACIYPSPSSPLLEVHDVGFQGLSGALVLEAKEPEAPTLCMGMLVRRTHFKRIQPVQAACHASDPAASPKSEVLDCILRNASSLDRIEATLASIESNMLTDIDSILRVARMRRSMVMPVVHMAHVMDYAPSVLLSDIVGMTEEDFM